MSSTNTSVAEAVTVVAFPGATATANSTSTATATATGVAEAAAVVKPPRKFPPPCWTQEETLALIDAYRDRWYALRRGYLRTADWDAVAAAVTQRCPGASPPKTSAQCRHKMEKLRQRYRAEKQRSLAYPTGRFFSSWFFFENMDAMENGTSISTAAGSNQDNSGNGFGLKTFLDQNVLKLKLNPKKFEGELDQKFDLDAMKNDGKLSSNYVSKVLNNGYSSYIDMGSDKEEEEDGVSFGSEYGAKNSPVVEVKAKKFRNVYGGVKAGFDVINGLKMRSTMNDELLPPALRGKRFGKVDPRVNSALDVDGGSESNGSDWRDGFWTKVGSDRSTMPPVSRGKCAGSVEGNNGYSSLSRSGAEKVKRGRDPVEEMVLSIKMLGEGFVRMEKMKMDMAREMEKMRMEMEMKRNELILESQRQIVDAFTKGLMEMKNKKKKTSTVPPDPSHSS